MISAMSAKQQHQFIHITAQNKLKFLLQRSNDSSQQVEWNAQEEMHRFGSCNVDFLAKFWEARYFWFLWRELIHFETSIITITLSFILSISVNYYQKCFILSVHFYLHQSVLQWYVPIIQERFASLRLSIQQKYLFCFTLWCSTKYCFTPPVHLCLYHTIFLETHTPKMVAELGNTFDTCLLPRVD